MSIADEIKLLKELLDGGTLTPSEFERSKQALLGQIAPAPTAELSREAFLGRWRIADESRYASEVSLFGDGKAKLTMQTAAETPRGMAAFITGSGLSVGSGERWVEGRILAISVKLGNVLGKALTWVAGKSENENFRFSITSVTQQEIIGRINGDKVIHFFRLDIKP